MPLIKSDKTMKDLLVNLHQDLFINNFSVHDEIVNIMDRFLHQSLALQMVKIIELKKVFDQIGYPYITFRFDVEYDKWGSYTATSALNPYKYDLEITKFSLKNKGFVEEKQEEIVDNNPAINIAENAIECKKDTQESQEKVSLNENGKKESESRTKEIKVFSYNEFLQFLEKISSLNSGSDTLIVVLPDNSRFRKEKVNIDSL